MAPITWYWYSFSIQCVVMDKIDKMNKVYPFGWLLVHRQRGQYVQSMMKCIWSVNQSNLVTNYKNEKWQWPLGAHVITIYYISSMPLNQCERHKLFLDNFFTSDERMCQLREERIGMKTTETIRTKRDRCLLLVIPVVLLS